MKRKPGWHSLLYRVRDWRARPLFEALVRYGRGDVLDVGGSDFVRSAVHKGARYATWTVLEPDSDPDAPLAAPGVRVERGDGCDMNYDDERFDTVLSIQVLEHVFEPLRMVQEIARVLRPGGHAIFLVPQTSTTHLAPHFHCNFSRYWIREALSRTGLEIVEYRALGGRWSSTASHLFYFFPQSLRAAGMSDPECHRSPLFYALYPLMVAVALIGIPVCLLLAAGDLSEEPNNHLVVARKPSRQASRSSAAGNLSASA